MNSDADQGSFLFLNAATGSAGLVAPEPEPKEDDDAILARAQRWLDEPRPEGAEPEQIGTLFAGIIPPPGAYRCRGVADAAALSARGIARTAPSTCKTILERPGICAACVVVREARERAELIQKQLRQQIPNNFLSWAKWDSAKLAERVPGGAETCDRVRTAMASGRVLLKGSAGAAKTALACAWLRERIEAGEERARFVSAIDLVDESFDEGKSLFELALSATSLVLDDLGEELIGAPVGGGIASQRVEKVVRLLRDRYNRDAPMVITTARQFKSTPDKPGLDALYGNGNCRRIFERRGVITLRSAL